MRQNDRAANTADNNEKKNKRPWWLLLLLLLLIALTLLTSVVVVIRIGNFLPENVNVIFIVPKKAEFHFGDDVWRTNTEIDLFRLSYTDGNGNVTVRSDSDTPIVAPGTENQYTFTLSNTGNVAVDYSMDINVNLSMGDFDAFPVEMKMQRNDGSYVFGSEDEWVDSTEIRNVTEPGKLGAGRFTTYTLFWKWDFEIGNDQLDTALGNASTESDISMSLSVGTYAEQSRNSALSDGEPIIDKTTGEPYQPYGGQIGGHFRMPYFPLLLILLILIAIILIIGYIRNRKDEKEKVGSDEQK